MSGGVDSSLVAALLKRQGYDVVGITLQLYDHGEATARKGACCAGQDIQDARRVADLIGIPHYVLDYERRFAEKVMSSFADSYMAGETPIPCVTCNQEIKFKDLLGMALELGAEKLATGHYIRLEHTANGPVLSRARDADRDQSYFLFATTRAQLERIMFPLGDMPKADVRELARELGLPVADKSDSQDICFVPKGRYTDVIERLKPGALKEGDIVHIDGRRLGRHDGIINYTVGQRRGIRIPSPEPLFVVRLDAAKNEVVVGPRQALETAALILKGVNWLGDEPLEQAAAAAARAVHVRVRSSQPTQPAILTSAEDGSIKVMLSEGQQGIAAGQACVFYADGSDSARVLGGGTIVKTLRSAEGPVLNAADRIHAADAGAPQSAVR
ncbi:MAG: tRNA 2-thiouridine(34) synthase MnmA [Hyphomicrobium sp. 32-62-53]|nr:MAG: tRNA 2-thiouridine(34) synthase MnmA [Hyphomicrobium sp. 12-62-95]OYY01704.1 MAG: tRNA 2-thiouridine(34) synthase MnmA [Hyphomicrobium sp. 32-62-53]